MPSDQEIEEYMLENFPQCSICKSTEGYVVKGLITETATCKNCKAEFTSPQFIDLKPMKEMQLWELPREGSWELSMERLDELHLKDLPVEFWKSLLVPKFCPQCGYRIK